MQEDIIVSGANDEMTRLLESLYKMEVRFCNSATNYNYKLYMHQI